jgi:hypothetical protein
MKRQHFVALLATLMTASAWGQEVSLYGTTMAQMWKEGMTGFEKASYTPATQYLGIDATKLGSDNLSLHLFGWGQSDLGGSSTFADGSKTGGYLNYGYLQYRFNQANAEIKAGRFTVNQGTGFEQVDGVSVRTDLVNGFTVSAFGGKPVLYKTVDASSQQDHDFQHDIIFGTRLGWRAAQVGEIGLSYVQDGSKAAQDLTIPSSTDYTRKRLGMDLLYTPTTNFDVRGQSVYDVTNQRTNLAEADYTATVKLGQVHVSGTYTERNAQFYFAGTNLPSLFRQDENDAFRGFGGKVTWLTTASFQAVVDYRHTHRDTVGDANRFGGDLRWDFNEKSTLLGVSAHAVNASDTLFVDPLRPYRSLSHKEMRVWLMTTKGRFTASVDGIVQRYDSSNPYLNNVRKLYEGVGSLSYKATENIKVSGDVSYGTSLAAVHETRGTLKAEYRFGTSKKGGK